MYQRIGSTGNRCMIGLYCHWSVKWLGIPWGLCWGWRCLGLWIEWVGGCSGCCNERRSQCIKIFKNIHKLDMYICVNQERYVSAKSWLFYAYFLIEIIYGISIELNILIIGSSNRYWTLCKFNIHDRPKSIILFNCLSLKWNQNKHRLAGCQPTQCTSIQMDVSDT